MEAAAEQLEVVGGHEEGADGDERQDPEAVSSSATTIPIAARGRDRDDGERDEHPARDRRPQRPAVQLVERVGADAHREGEGEQRRAPRRPQSTLGGEAAADDDVATGARRCTAGGGA